MVREDKKPEDRILGHPMLGLGRRCASSRGEGQVAAMSQETMFEWSSHNRVRTGSEDVSLLLVSQTRRRRNCALHLEGASVGDKTCFGEVERRPEQRKQHPVGGKH